MALPGGMPDRFQDVNLAGDALDLARARRQGCSRFVRWDGPAARVRIFVLGCISQFSPIRVGINQFNHIRIGIELESKTMPMDTDGVKNTI